MKIIYILFCLLLPSLLLAQSPKFGIITDAETGETLVGANVIIVGTSLGTTTDIAGEFSITVAEGALLAISYIGYHDAEIKANGDTLFIALNSDALQIKDVVVTATKRREHLQDIPIAATSITGVGIMQNGTPIISDALSSVPGVVAQNGVNFPQFSIRGIYTSIDNIGIENAIGLYIDGVYHTRGWSFNNLLMDIERIEVLRGPQGTFFGRNTVGGVMHIITETPKLHSTYGIVDLNFGNYKYIQTRGMLNLAAGEKSALRISGAYQTRKGVLKNLGTVNDGQDYNGIDRFALGAKWYTEFSSDFDLLLKVSYDKAYGNTFDEFADIIDGFDGSDGIDRAGAGDGPAAFPNETLSASATFNLKLGNSLNLTSISSYLTNNNNEQKDVDYSLKPLLAYYSTHDLATLTQEIRISSPITNPFSFTSGIYLFNDNIDGDYRLDLGTAIPEAFTGDSYSDYAEIIFSKAKIKRSSIAGFFSLKQRLSSKLDLRGGIRYTYEKNNLDHVQYSTLYETIPGDPNSVYNAPAMFGYPDVGPSNAGGTEGEFSGDISLTYKINQGSRIYGLVSRGYKASGFNSVLVTGGFEENLKYDPEYVTNYELGYKSSLFNNRVILNASVFFMDYKDKQEQIQIGTSLLAFNADKVTIKGLELETMAIILEGLTIKASLGLLDAKYGAFMLGSDLDFTNKKLAYAPDVTASFAPEYNFDLSSNLKGLLTFDIQYRGNTHTTAENNPIFKQDPFALVNAKIGVSSSNGKYKIYFWGRNLTDEIYTVWGREVFSTAVALNPPRMFGLELQIGLFGKENRSPQ